MLLAAALSVYSALMAKALIFAAPGVEDHEFWYAYYRLQEAGFTVDVVTHNDGPTEGKYGIPIKPNLTVAAFVEKEYEIVVVPGGYECPDRLRQVPKIVDAVRTANARGAIVTSVCHGPWVLVSAGVLKGRKATSYPGCADDLKNAGATYVDQPVVTDGNIVTAQHYRDCPGWMAATLEAWKARPTR